MAFRIDVRLEQPNIQSHTLGNLLKKVETDLIPWRGRFGAEPTAEFKELQVHLSQSAGARLIARRCPLRFLQTEFTFDVPYKVSIRFINGEHGGDESDDSSINFRLGEDSPAFLMFLNESTAHGIASFSFEGRDLASGDAVRPESACGKRGTLRCLEAGTGGESPVECEDWTYRRTAPKSVPPLRRPASDDCPWGFIILNNGESLADDIERGQKRSRRADIMHLNIKMDRIRDENGRPCIGGSIEFRFPSSEEATGRGEGGASAGEDAPGYVLRLRKKCTTNLRATMWSIRNPYDRRIEWSARLPVHYFQKVATLSDRPVCLLFTPSKLQVATLWDENYGWNSHLYVYDRRQQGTYFHGVIVRTADVEYIPLHLEEIRILEDDFRSGRDVAADAAEAESRRKKHRGSLESTSTESTMPSNRFSIASFPSSVPADELLCRSGRQGNPYRTPTPDVYKIPEDLDAGMEALSQACDEDGLLELSRSQSQLRSQSQPRTLSQESQS